LAGGAEFPSIIEFLLDRGGAFDPSQHHRGERQQHGGPLPCRHGLPERGSRRQVAHRGIQANAPTHEALGVQVSDRFPTVSNYEMHPRWDIELFFKWIKQHLRIKAFFGTNENAVKTQIWIAISVYVLVAIVKKRLGADASLYTILQILSLTLFEKTNLNQLLNDAGLQPPDSVDSNQLNLFS
jgi:hypothetical protein